MTCDRRYPKALSASERYDAIAQLTKGTTSYNWSIAGGRTKGCLNAKTIFENVFGREIVVTENG